MILTEIRYELQVRGVFGYILTISSAYLRRRWADIHMTIMDRLYVDLQRHKYLIFFVPNFC